MINTRTVLTMSVVFLVATLTPRSAGGQTPAEPKDKNYWCGGSVLGGLANSGSKFTVKVFAFVSTDIYGQNHHERPVGAAQVVLLTNAKTEHEISAVTDARGIAEFSDVPSGTYTVHIEGARFWESQATLTVDALNGTPTEVHLLWPQRAYIVRQVRGWLMDSFTGIWSSAEPNYKPRPFVGAQVQLIDLTSGLLIARTQTDDKGYYEFSSVGPGFYLVRFNEDSDAGSPNFNMAVELDDKAAREHPPALRAEKHDCGPGLAIY
jgi:Carboxypeptidase regulatory-like domain